MKGGVDDKNKKNKKDKKDKKEHHHHHHKATDKSTGPLLVPPISLNDRIVKEMHAEPLPSPTSPKVVSPKPPSLVKQPEVPKITLTASSAEQPGVIATLLKWVKDNVFSRQKQISNAYSNQFLQTMTAIQKRFSANDARIEELAKPQALRFSSVNEEKSVTVVDLSVTTTPKPTLH